MKRIIRSMQNLGEQAARLSAAASRLPGHVAEIRQSVSATAGELQNLKSDIKSNVAELQLGSEDQLSEAMMEINTHARVFGDVGFKLEGVDIELSPAQRLVVHLLRIGDAGEDEFRELIQTHQSLPTIRAILSSLLKVRTMASTIELGGLDCHRVLIGIGANPVIRLCWRAPVAGATRSLLDSGGASAPLVATTGSTLFGPSESFFPAASPVPLEASASETECETESPPPLPAAAAPAREKSVPQALPASTDPLARFKKMPDLGSKR